jgi:hypothetical protein
MVVALLFILGSYYFFQKTTVHLKRFDLLFAWFIRLGFSALFLFIYYDYYANGATQSDIGSCMHDSRILNNVFYQSPKVYFDFLFGLEDQQLVARYLSQTNRWSSGYTVFLDDTKNVIRINSLLFFLSKGSIFVHLVIISFFSLLGIRELYLTFQDRIWIPKRLFWFALIIFPSLAFWSSSLLKEPFLIIGLALFLRASLSQLSRSSKLWRWLVGGLLLMLFKPYVFLCLLLAILIVAVANFISKRSLVKTSMLVVTTIVVLFIFVPTFHQQPMRFLSRKQFDFNNMAKGGVHVYADSCFYYFTPNQEKLLRISDSMVYLTQPVIAQKEKFGMVAPSEKIYLTPTTVGWPLYYKAAKSNSYIALKALNYSPIQLIKSIPEALTNAAFRPYFWDNGGILKWVSILESLALFVFLSVAMWKKIECTASDKQTITTLLWFSILLLLLIGFTTPVIGAIVRYRIPAYLAIFLIAASGTTLKKET